MSERIIYINNITHTTEDENSKIKYADRVYMTEDEYQNLTNEYGVLKAQRCVKELDMYKKSKGVEYEDDYATIKRWVIDRVEEIENKKQIKENKKIIIRILAKENIQIIFLILSFFVS